MKTSVEYAYTRRGQLAGKYLGGKLKPDAAVEYEYAKNGQITARTANGVRQTYEYDFKGQLLGVREGEEYVERYAYDKAGNMVKKVVRVRSAECGVQSAWKDKTTTFTFDDANQLVSSTTDGITTRYEYDAAGRMIKEGDKTYTYGYLDKVMSVRDGANTYTYTYHPDGQLASADYGTSSETFTWDGLALIQRGDEHFLNEPHVGGGNPVVSSKGTSYFNDMLGTTVGAKSGKQYSAATLTAFGEDLTHHSSTSTSNFNSFFTGKPQVAGLGHAFLMRNYRAGLGKWQTADPMGYPDGWNALAYCNNGVTSAVDYLGCETWAEYAKHTAKTYENWNCFATVNHANNPIQGERFERLYEKHVLISTRDYGIRIIDGKKYHVYQDNYCDVYCSELYGALDPQGNLDDLLVAAGVGTGMVGLVCIFANPLVGGVVSVAGIAISIAGAWMPNWKYLGDIYRYHPETLKIEYRKELVE